ncbi:MAG: hypothetical protein FGM14_16550 [Flavobacteriales bacterium]|nr:hypothetical protein [Flavobacteriales bacterium]
MATDEIKPIFDFDNIGLADIQNEADKQISQTSTSIEKLVQSCKVDLTKDLPPPPIAMKIKHFDREITLFSKGNFSIVTGKAKSRKSFLISMLMATAIKGSFQNQFFCPTNGMNVLFDTEQAEHKVLQVSKRICRLAEIEHPENFISYHLRTLDPLERLEVIEHVLSTTPNLNFVAIDGIVDLDIDPILQAEQAQNIISKLMKWTEIYNIHIVCVLHYNKTVATLLGHLGSFAHRKADCIIEVEKDTESENISFVKAVDCREMEFLPFAFSIDEFGMPNIESEMVLTKSKATPKTESKPKKKVLTPCEVEPNFHAKILIEAFKVNKEQTYSDLWKTLKLAVESICNEKLGDNKAKEFLTYYQQEQKIIKIEVKSNSKSKLLYTLNEPKEIEFT